jgi:perosamine synthetase
MLRFLPPAGAPLRMDAILSSLRAAIHSNGDGKKYLAAVAAHFRVNYVFGSSSGRAALWLILKSLRRLHPERDVVALPGYTCFSVPAAVVRAGLKIHPVDIDPHTLDFDPSQLGSLPDKRVLCIIACNLFGFPNDFSPIRQAASAKGVYIIDDAAQALGSTRHGHFAGTFGDVGLYSLGRGKAVGSIEGGLIVTNSEAITAAIRAETKGLEPSSTAHGARLLLEMFGYSVFLRPRLFWIPNSTPFLKLGTTEFKPSFPTTELHSLSLALLPRLLDGLGEVNETRRANARAIMQGVGTDSSLGFLSPHSGSNPTFVRLPVVAPDNMTREQAVHQLRRAGIGASPFYPSAICEIPGIKSHMADGDFHCKHAEALSERLFTLPVHPFVSSRDLKQMIEILSSL